MLAVSQINYDVPVSLYWTAVFNNPCYAIVPAGTDWSQLSFCSDYSVSGATLYWKPTEDINRKSGIWIANSSGQLFAF